MGNIIFVAIAGDNIFTKIMLPMLKLIPEKKIGKNNTGSFMFVCTKVLYEYID
jgi:hypothetical protein